MLRYFSSVRRHVSLSSTHFLDLRCPSEGCSGDGEGEHAVDMSKPPPYLDNFCQSVHSCSISLFFWDSVGPVNFENASKAFGLEHIHTAPYRRTGTRCFRRS